MLYIFISMYMVEDVMVVVSIMMYNVTFLGCSIASLMVVSWCLRVCLRDLKQFYTISAGFHRSLSLILGLVSLIICYLFGLLRFLELAGFVDLAWKSEQHRKWEMPKRTLNEKVNNVKYIQIYHIIYYNTPYPYLQ